MLVGKLTITLQSQGCSNASFKVILSDGTSCSILLMRSYAGEEITDGIVKSPFKIIFYKSGKLEALKGTVPESITNKSTPKLQVSTVNPS